MRRFHALRSGCENDFGAKGAQQNATLQAHGVGHGDDQPVAFHRGDERQADAGIAAGRLDQDGLAGVNITGLLGFVDHADANAVFHAGDGVEAFQLGDDGRFGSGSDFVEPYQRSVTNQFGDIIGDFHDVMPFSPC